VSELSCTICGHPGFAKLRVEIVQGAATYLVCPRLDCITEATSRARANLIRAAGRQGHGDVIDVDVDNGLPPARTLSPDR
jgi:hypothetical protein